MATPDEYIRTQAILRRWIQSVLQDTGTGQDLAVALQDGSVLCNLALELDPESIPWVHGKKPTKQEAHENIAFFLAAAHDLGVSKETLFAPGDLYEAKNMVKVFDMLMNLADEAERRELAPNAELSTIVQTMEGTFTADPSPEQVEAANKYIEASNQTLSPRSWALQMRNAARRHPIGRSSINTIVGGRRPISRGPGRGSVSSMSHMSESGTSLGTADHRHSSGAAAVIDPRFEAALPTLITIQRRARWALFFRRMDGRILRRELARELLTTERTYVKNLQTIRKVFIQPLEILENHSQAILDKESFRIVFGDILIILNVNQRFLGDLEDRWAEWGPETKLGDVFLRMAEFFKVYSQYTKKYAVANITLANALKTNKAFAKHIAAMERLPLCNHQDIFSHLIQIVQRIPRYQLLLERLIKATPPWHVDYVDLRNAFMKIVNIADYVNAKVTEAENIERVMAVQQMIVGSPEKLASPHRRFVLEGALCLRKPGEKEGKDRYCFLFNDILVICKEKKLIGKGKFKYKERIALQTYDMRPDPETLDAEGNIIAFELFNPVDDRSYANFRASNVDLAEKWLINMDECRTEVVDRMRWRNDVKKAMQEKEAIAAGGGEPGSGESTPNAPSGSRRLSARGFAHSPSMVSYLRRDSSSSDLRSNNSDNSDRSIPGPRDTGIGQPQFFRANSGNAPLSAIIRRGSQRRLNGLLPTTSSESIESLDGSAPNTTTPVLSTSGSGASLGRFAARRSVSNMQPLNAIPPGAISPATKRASMIAQAPEIRSPGPSVNGGGRSEGSAQRSQGGSSSTPAATPELRAEDSSVNPSPMPSSTGPVQSESSSSQPNNPAELAKSESSGSLASAISEHDPDAEHVQEDGHTQVDFRGVLKRKSRGSSNSLEGGPAGSARADELPPPAIDFVWDEGTEDLVVMPSSIPAPIAGPPPAVASVLVSDSSDSIAPVTAASDDGSRRGSKASLDSSTSESSAGSDAPSAAPVALHHDVVATLEGERARAASVSSLYTNGGFGRERAGSTVSMAARSSKRIDGLPVGGSSVPSLGGFMNVDDDTVANMSVGSSMSHNSSGSSSSMERRRQAQATASAKALKLLGVSQADLAKNSAQSGPSAVLAAAAELSKDQPKPRRKWSSLLRRGKSDLGRSH